MTKKKDVEKVLERKNKKADESMKWLLHDKCFIAHVVKNKIDDYKDLSKEKIKDLIKDVVPVNSSRVTGNESEDNSLDDGFVRFDSLITMYLPNGSSDLAEIRLNIEAQNRDDMQYELVTRGIYYCSRLISSQKGTFFEGSDYHKIRKVYSIWLVLNPKKERRGCTNSYVIEEKRNEDSYSIGKKNFDLLEVIIVNCKDEGSHDQVIGAMDTLLSTNLTKDEIMQKLRNDYDFEITEEFEGGFESMCTMEEILRDRWMEEFESRGEARMQKLVLAMSENGEASKITEVFANNDLLKEYLGKYGI